MTGLHAPTSERADLDDQALLGRVAKGDTQALEILYDRYARLVYGTAIRMLGLSELAEDVVQETFWRVWRRSATFQSGRGQVAGWILGIARNLAIDELRRQRSRPTPVYDQDDQPVLREMEDTRMDVHDAAVDAERRQLITRALAELPGEQREVIQLAYFGGLSQSEIAARLKNPIGTVKTRVRLGLQKLRDILAAQGVQREDVTE